MLQRSATIIDTAQNHNGYIPYDYNIPLEPVQEVKPSGAFIAESTTVNGDYLKLLISLLFNLEHSYSVVNYTIDLLVNEPSVFEPITVQPPPKRILASMSVELSAKDLKRRLPKPVISLESEVEP